MVMGDSWESLHKCKARPPEYDYSIQKRISRQISAVLIIPPVFKIEGITDIQTHNVGPLPWILSAYEFPVKHSN